MRETKVDKIGEAFYRLIKIETEWLVDCDVDIIVIHA